MSRDEQHAENLEAKAKYYAMEEPDLVDALVCTDEELIAALRAGAAALRAPQGGTDQCLSIPPVDGECPMAAPTFDESGDYPSDETLQAIREWPASRINKLFEFVLAAWHWSDWATTELRPSEREMVAEDGEKFLRLATGGWSGNEEIVSALDDNLWARHQWCVSAQDVHSLLDTLLTELKEQTDGGNVADSTDLTDGACVDVAQPSEAVALPSDVEVLLKEADYYVACGGVGRLTVGRLAAALRAEVTARQQAEQALETRPTFEQAGQMLLVLKGECERQHARAEQAESALARLRAQETQG